MKYNKNEVTGKMRDRIILQNVTRSRSLTGFASESWADTTTIWAFAESKLPGSNENIIDGKNTAKNVCDFTIRYISTISEESRVVFKNKIYQVKNIKISHDRRFISFQGVYYDSYSTVIGLQSCSASLLAQSSLSAALMRVIKYQSSLNAFGSVSADIALVQKVASSLNAFGTLTADINFVQKAQASLTGAGTTAANLTVASASLLLDLYPSAAVAYSLRKLRTAYTGSAVRVRASTSGAEGDVSFDVNSTISASSTVTVTAVGTSGLSIGQQVTFSTFWNAGGSNQNVFVTRWYDQSGSGNNATQTTQAWQPQIVSSGSVIIVNNKPGISFTNTNLHHLQITNTIFTFTGNSTLFHVSRNRNNATLQYGGIIAQGPINPQLGVALAIQWQQYPNSETRATTDIYAPGGVSTNNTQNINTQYLATFQWQNWSTHKTNGNTIIAINGVNQALTAYGGNPSNFGSSTIYIGRTVDNNSASCFLGDIQEIVVYTTAFLQTNIDGAESNINTHYGIY